MTGEHPHICSQFVDDLEAYTAAIAKTITAIQTHIERKPNAITPSAGAEILEGMVSGCTRSLTIFHLITRNPEHASQMTVSREDRTMTSRRMHLRTEPLPFCLTLNSRSTTIIRTDTATDAAPTS